MVRTYMHSIESHGKPLNLEFATMFSRDARTLAISDGILVLSSAICVPFAKLIANGWIKYHWTGVILQHTLQAAVLFCAISWTFNRYVRITCPPAATLLPKPVLLSTSCFPPICICRS